MPRASLEHARRRSPRPGLLVLLSNPRACVRSTSPRALRTYAQPGSDHGSSWTALVVEFIDDAATGLAGQVPLRRCRLPRDAAVRQVIPHSGAHRFGLCARAEPLQAERSGQVAVGDAIVSVAGQPCSQLPYDSVVALIVSAPRPMTLGLVPGCGDGGGGGAPAVPGGVPARPQRRRLSPGVSLPIAEASDEEDNDAPLDRYTHHRREGK